MATPSTRRTQEQRTAETRGKLLDATIQSILDVGYAATTTRRVAELAGVSAGAQTHHFPYRVDLVGAAVERLAEQRIAAARDKAQELPTEREDRARALLELLWQDFSSPLFTTFVKLWIAAADDPELHARLVPVERDLRRQILGLAVEFAGELTAIPGWEQRLQVVLTATRGLALTQAFEPRDDRPRRDPWPPMRDELLRMILAPA